MRERIVGVCVLLACAVVLATPVVTARGSDMGVLADGNTEFAFKLYGLLRNSDGNLFLSPYSISTALAMTYAGARENTEAQMARAMCFNLDQEKLHIAFAGLEKELNAVQKAGKVQLSVANSLWPQKKYPFLEEYLSLAGKYYGVSITPMDYAAEAEKARQEINEWVEGRTNRKIKDLIKPGILDALTRMVLVNAIYFKGDWAEQFDRKATADLPFYTAPDKSKQVPMMTMKSHFRYADMDDLQALELPYAGGQLSMVAVLPKAKDGLDGLEQALSAENLKKWMADMRRREVKVYLPKFKMTCEFGLSDVLKSMGMTDVFDASKSNLSGMDGRKAWLYITAVLHKAFVEVNEEGTEAAAATGVVVGVRAMPMAPPVFRADHPFVFMIRDNGTGSILFMGRVADPE